MFKIKIKLSCSFCITPITTNQIMDIIENSFYEFIEALDRGSLTY